ncbi:hypothetical protein HCH52_10915 [Oscillospiraceae bacterium HV4-5-C5C]|nr:hypothetical protein [Oscillospiraceae bacterium HV4-5-C5C]
MYLSGVSVRRVDDITEALCGNKHHPSRSESKTRKCMSILRNGAIVLLQSRLYPYMYVDGLCPCSNWIGEYKNVAI